jgi:hypothetical protein
MVRLQLPLWRQTYRYHRLLYQGGVASFLSKDQSSPHLLHILGNVCLWQWLFRRRTVSAEE